MVNSDAFEPIRLPIGYLGVPEFSIRDIEKAATRFLDALAPRCLREPLPTPLREICRTLQYEHSVNVDLEADLGENGSGLKVVGRTDYGPFGILLDRTVERESTKWRYSLAHELGHLVLHRKMAVDARAELLDQFGDTEEDIGFVKDGDKNPREWLEWQANYFAGAILMPREMVVRTVVERQLAMNITRNLGRVYVDLRDSAIVDRNSIASSVGLRFNASRNVTLVRLRQLGVLVEVISAGLTTIEKW